MATLVFSAVGTALGGPVGGALGSLVGQAVDQQLFGSGPRRGPRLGDLAIQTASYGTMIPRIYGAMRVAGSVIWATDLVESETAVSGGKGGSDSLQYSYSASFAVALSSRRVLRIGRVWADGKLLRGAAGDLKVAGAMRFHEGREGQAVDPLIASVEGVAGASAFRGLALAVFEDLALGEYGNRIPLLTFEVIADEGAVAAGFVLGDASGGAIDSGSMVALGGYAAHGGDRRSAVTPVVDLLGIRVREGTGVASDRGTVVRIATAREVGCAGSETGRGAMVRSRAPLGELPSGMSLGYYDPARDYQAGLAGAGEAGGRTFRTIDFAAALSADGARGLAERRLARSWAERERATLHLPPSFLDLQPGDVVEADGLGGVWEVERVEVAALIVTAQLVRRVGGGAVLPADGGRASSGVDAVAAATQLVLLDLPVLDGTSSGPTLALAAASAGSWRSISVSVTANAAERPALSVVRAAVMGRAVGVLAAGSAVLRDDVGQVVVQMIDPAAWLTSCDDDALAMGMNLAALGNELIQFEVAEALGGGRFRLSRLLRGRRGSDWAIGGHSAGEAFVMIDAARLITIALPVEMVGAEVAVLPHGLGDGAAVALRRVAAGEALRPPSPCQLAVAGGLGGLQIDWVRRSRMGWAWSDGLDAPIGEAGELYRVRVEQGAISREWSCAAPGLAIAGGELALFSSGAAIVSVVQVGDRAVSRPALATMQF
ncbi:MAG: phage tail protein [Sphingomicrobium sp.]